MNNETLSYTKGSSKAVLQPHETRCPFFSTYAYIQYNNTLETQ